MKKEETEAKAEEAQQMNKDSQVKGEEDEDSEHKKKDHTLSDASPSLSHFSPPTPPSLRSRKPPSPPVHSSPKSSISDDHSSPTHDKRSSPPPLDSSSDSSISTDLCSVADGTPPVEGEHFSPIPSEKPASPVVVANRFQVEPKVVTKVDPGAQEGVVGVKDVEEGTGGGDGDGNNRRLRPDVNSFLRSKKEGKLNKALLGLRIVAFVFCLASFSVLAADRERGWALDSFYSYKEFRYSLSVNVLGSMYSLLQVSDLIKYFITKKYILWHPLRGYFNFSMDQILTYLLMSASSSAATRAYDWESNWGKDLFPDMANASVGLSFVAFVAFAFTSLVSGYILCKFR